jgi:hypothetical protein
LVFHKARSDRFERRPLKVQSAWWSRSDRQLAKAVRDWVVIPQEAKPSAEFVKHIRATLPQSIATLPPELVEILKQKNLRIALYNSPSEYVGRLDTFEDFPVPTAMYRGLVSLKDAIGPIPKENEAVVDDLLKHHMVLQHRTAMRHAKAYYFPGDSQIVVHEKTALKLPTQIKAGTLRHEVGHYVDCLPRHSYVRMTSWPRFQETLFQDLAQAAKKRIIPIQRVGSDQYEVLPDPTRWRPEQPNPQHFSYYLPLAPQDRPHIHEAFAEVFASTYGGGEYADKGFIHQKLYPKTSKALQAELLPRLYELMDAEASGKKVDGFNRLG